MRDSDDRDVAEARVMQCQFASSLTARENRTAPRPPRSPITSQSTFGHRAEGTSKIDKHFGQLMAVSIRPRPNGQGKRPHRARASRTGEFQSAPGPTARGNVTRIAKTVNRYCFNPPPAQRPGETGQGRNQSADRRVSIRPRPNGQGKPHCPRGKSRSWKRCFNPPPAQRPGETPKCGLARRSRRSFNPPPAQRPGETWPWEPSAGP